MKDGKIENQLASQIAFEYVHTNMAVTQTTPKLSGRQQQVLDYLLQRQREEGIPPSTREIQAALGLGSQTQVVQLIHALQRKGAIRTLPGKARGIVAVQPPASSPADDRSGSLSPFIDVPLCGEIQAGLPSDTSPQTGDTLPVHAAIMGLTPGSQPYALRVRGNSMTGACIQDGDYVVLDRAREPRSGDVVAALLDGQSTLKRYMVEDGKVYLKAENPLFPVIKPTRELLVQGVMVGLIRSTGV